jgi:hypothetical protein
VATPNPYQPFRKVQQVTDNVTLADLQRAAKDIRKRVAALKIKQGIGARVRAAQLTLVLAAVNKTIDQMRKPPSY